MSKRRQFFNAIFFLGTMLAAFGWMGQLRQWPGAISKFVKFGTIAIAGHVIQVVGAFGNLLTPDREEVSDDNEKFN